jgi:hypothetical protein
MTVEIKQLVIRAIAEPSRAAVEPELRRASLEPLDREAIDAIIEACVHEVLRELERRRRR